MSPNLAEFDVMSTARACPDNGGVGNTSPDSSTLDLSLPDARDTSNGGHLPRDPPPESYETVDYLLREYTALHLAAGEGHTEVVNLLLANGASVDSSSRWLCSCRPQRGLWQTMLDPAIPDYRLEPIDWLPLHAAICFSHIETAKNLLWSHIFWTPTLNSTSMFPMSSV
jgi:hypothetical protein